MNQRPSHLRIFAKSMHLLAGGWTVAVVWLWLAGVRQHVRRHNVVPDDYGLPTLVSGLISALALELLALLFVRWTGSAMTPRLQRREWHHAFWWAAFPNGMLLYTVYVLIFGVD